MKTKLIMIFAILQFAGVAFMLFALLRWLKSSPTVILLVGLALSVFGTFVRSVCSTISPPSMPSCASWVPS